MEYCRVLIVDDEMITRQGIKHMMIWENEGFQIVGEAANGQEGLELVEKLSPHIVLSDMVMPVLNGIDFSFILREKYPQVQLIMLSSFDDFDYVKQTLLNGAVDYILKPTLNPENLLEALQKAVHNIPGMELFRQKENLTSGKLLERYLSGLLDSLDVAVFQKDMPYMYYRLLAIDLKNVCRGSRHRMDQLKTWIAQDLEGHDNYGLCSAFINEEILCYVVNYRMKDEAQLFMVLHGLADKIAKAAERTFFVVSEVFSEVESLRNHYEEEICPGVKQRFYFPGKSLVCSDELSNEDKIEHFGYETFTELLNEKNFENTVDMVEDYAHYLCSRKHDEYLTKNLVKNLLYNLLMNMSDSEIWGEIPKREYFKRIDSSEYVDTFLQQCGEIFSQIKSMIPQNAHGNERIREMKQYIKEHSGEKLDLAELADVFGFNYHYISSYFNQHISEGFSGYLNKIRVEKACALLKEHKLPISDVSGEVGYSDHGYFCRVFKKLTGQTPSEYRRKA